MVTQSLILPGAAPGTKPAQVRNSPPETLFVSTGRRLYVMGDIDGGFRAQSNPYDLHAFGAAQPDDPLANKLQGVWAQPVKALNGYAFEIERASQIWTLNDAHSFTQSFVDVSFNFQQEGLSALRTDFVPLDQPLLLTTLTLTNIGANPEALKVRFQVFFDLEDAWFTSLAETRNRTESIAAAGEYVVARAASAPDAWAVAVGGGAEGARVGLVQQPGQRPQAIFEYPVVLAAGSQQSWTFGVAVDSQDGVSGAMATVKEGLKQGSAWHDQKQKWYADQLQEGPHLHSPSPALNLAFDEARANLLMLEAESPALGRYFYAGLQTFPFWFSADTAYSTPGLAVSGLSAALKNALLVGTRIQLDGRVPHQISPSGRIAFHGNAQETPQWVTAAWDYYRWTGDRDFLAEVYPAVLKGLFEYTLTTIDPDGDNFPSGPGIVEVEGMGAEKLDAAVYTWAALRALAEMAEVIGDSSTRDEARSRIGQIEACFDATWWDAEGGTYAMSLDGEANRRAPAPHWAVITPLEVGLATPEHAASTLRTIEGQYLNRWGIKHTVGTDERVWTLPTATLSRAAFRNQRPEMGLIMLGHIAETLEHGSIGLFHELIPDGLCILQLWSGAAFLGGVVEDLLGIQVRADLGILTIAPQLPDHWGEAVLENLTFAGHHLDVRFSSEIIEVTHITGPGELKVSIHPRSGEAKDFIIEPEETARFLR